MFTLRQVKRFLFETSEGISETKFIPKTQFKSSII